MDVNQLRSLKPELDAFLERYFPLFGREENHSHASILVQGLLAKGERRNVENIAESMEGGVVRTLQKFISQAAWDDRAVLDELREHVKEELAHDEGVVNVDETGFPKKGTKSVGVKRQILRDSGPDGQLPGGRVPQLLLRRRTRPLRPPSLLARRMGSRPRAAERGGGSGERRLPDQTGTGPRHASRGGSGRPPVSLGWRRRAVRRQSDIRPRSAGAGEVVRPGFVGRRGHVWLEAPTVRRPGEPGQRGGRPARRIKAVEKPQPLSKVLKTIRASEWRRVTVAEGSQGPRIYEYVERTVWFSEGGSPAEQPERLLIRRSVDQQADVKFQRSNAPASVALQRLTEVGGCRWTIEEGFQCGKGECGLDEYEARGWIAWHHHTSLFLLALWFLTQQRRRLGKKRAADDRPRSPRSAATSTRSAAVERTRNPRVVGLAARAQQRGEGVPQASPRPAAARVK